MCGHAWVKNFLWKRARIYIAKTISRSQKDVYGWVMDEITSLTVHIQRTMVLLADKEPQHLLIGYVSHDHPTW